MSVQLNTGFSGYIAVLDNAGKEHYKKSISSPKEAKEFYLKYSKTVEGWGIVQSILVPTRTDTLENFANDFFLPTLVNHALKVENVFLRVLASIFAVVLDVATFPVRVITALFRVAYNYMNEEKHPLSNIIKNEEALQKGEFAIEIHFDIVEITPADDEGVKLAARKVDDWKEDITTRVLPGLHSRRTHSVEKTTYIGMDDEWTVQGFSKEASSKESFSA